MSLRKGQTINPLARYLTDHWQGNHGLGWSFWVNLVALRLALFLLQEALTAALPSETIFPLWLMMPLVVVFHGGVFVWQAVGLLRAADAYSRSSGQMFKVWGTQLTLIVTFLWVLSYSFEAWHLTQPRADDTFADLDAQRTSLYDLAVSSDHRSIVIEGSFELGITKRLTTLLDAYPTVTTIHLASPGGNIFEARGLAAQIQSRGLGTNVDDECSSACTLVFMGGATRTIAVGAKFGFHQYRLNTNVEILAVDPQREQQRDLAAFRQAGVAPWFLEKLYQSGSQDMWYPEIADLLDAGVVTEISDPANREN